MATVQVSKITFANNSNEYVLKDSNAVHSNVAQVKNTVLAGPASGSDANPTFRALVAADIPISDWAKAATKPGYSFSEINNKPTTLSGYGITDANINNGVITLGSDSITPLTSHQTVTNSNATLAWGAATTIATIGSTNIQVSLPANPNTDVSVTQTAVSDDKDYRIILSHDATDSAETYGVNKNTNLRFNPSNQLLSIGGSISATGNLDVTGSSNLSVINTTDLTTGSLIVNGTSSFTQIPTSVTPASTSNDTSVATTEFVNTAIAGIVPSSAVFTDTYVSAAAFAEDTSNSTSPLKMTLTRSGSITTAVTANLPKISSSTPGIVPKGAAVSSQSTTTKFLREDGTWAAPSYIANTDINVTQTNTTADAEYRLLLSGSANDTTETTTSNKNTNLRFNPTTQILNVGGSITASGNLTINGTATLNNNAYIEDLTANTLLVNGNANFLQIPTSITPANSSNDTSIATTAFVKNNLGNLSGAMHFKGTTTTAMSDGLTTAAVTIGGSSYTPEAGDVVLYSDSEYVWTGSLWEQLGRDSSFKTQQSAVTDAAYNGADTSTTFVSAVTQDANGVITVTKRNLPSTMAPTSHVHDLSEITTGADDLKAIEDLTGTSGFLKKTGASTWTLDTNTYLTSYTETDPTVPSWAKSETKPTYTYSEVGAAASSHTHGNIANGGTISSTAVTPSGASGAQDYILISDASNSGKIERGIAIGTDTTKYLRNDGTWQSVSTSDTKQNVTLAATSKAYITGVTTAPTSTPQGLTAVADTGVYLDTTAGMLTAKSFKVVGSANSSNTIESNATNNIYFSVNNTIPIVIRDTDIRSGASVAGTINLGTTDNKWNNVYANSFIGDLTGNASTATSATTADSATYATTAGSATTADTATGFTSGKQIALTGVVTGSANGGNGSNGWSITTTYPNQTANTVLAGPASGNAAAPTFRALQPDDLPVATTSANGAMSSTDKTKLDNLDSVFKFDPNGTKGAAYQVTDSGYYSTATGNGSLAIGFNGTASGIASFFGGSKVANHDPGSSSGDVSFAFGGSPVASGNYAVAMGYITTASNTAAVAMGALSEASGRAAAAFGNNTIAAGSSQMVIGQYNIQDTGSTNYTTGSRDYLFIIGNGTKDSNDVVTRSNAMTVDWTGDVNAATSYSIADSVSMVYNSTTNALDFVFA